MILSIFIKDKDKLENIRSIIQDFIKMSMTPLLWVIENIKALGQSITKVVGAFKKIFKGDFIGGIKDLFMNFIETMLRPIISLGKVIGRFKIVKIIGSALKKAFTWLGSKFMDWFIMPIVNHFKTLGSMIKQNLIDPILNLFKTIATNIFDHFRNLGSMIKQHLIDPVVNVFASIGDIIKNFMSNPAQFTRILFENISSFVSDLFTKISNGITTFLQTNPIVKLLDDYIVKPIKSLFEMVGNILESINPFGEGGLVSKAGDALGGVANKGLDLLKSLLPTRKVDDAIIKSDGSIIQTHPDDNIIATKNQPLIAGFNAASNNSRSKQNTTPAVSIKDESTKVLENILLVLQQILQKDPVVVESPKQSMADLDFLLLGK
jgi:hypothetical protein